MAVVTFSWGGVTLAVRKEVTEVDGDKEGKEEKGEEGGGCV